MQDVRDLRPSGVLPTQRTPEHGHAGIAKSIAKDNGAALHDGLIAYGGQAGLVGANGAALVQIVEQHWIEPCKIEYPDLIESDGIGYPFGLDAKR